MKLAAVLQTDRLGYERCEHRHPVIKHLGVVRPPRGAGRRTFDVLKEPENRDGPITVASGYNQTDGTLRMSGLSRDLLPAEGIKRQKRTTAHSGDCDRPFQPKMITDSGDRDHAVTRPTGSA